MSLDVRGLGGSCGSLVLPWDEVLGFSPGGSRRVVGGRVARRRGGGSLGGRGAVTHGVREAVATTGIERCILGSDVVVWSASGARRDGEVGSTGKVLVMGPQSCRGWGSGMSCELTSGGCANVRGHGTKNPVPGYGPTAAPGPSSGYKAPPLHGSRPSDLDGSRCTSQVGELQSLLTGLSMSRVWPADLEVHCASPLRFPSFAIGRSRLQSILPNPARGLPMPLCPARPRR